MKKSLAGENSDASAGDALDRAVPGGNVPGGAGPIPVPRVRGLACAVILAVAFAGAGRAATVPPWSESFETNPVNSVIGSFAGWFASDADVVVQTNVVWSEALGTNAVIVPPGRVVSNLVTSAVSTNVWFEFFLTNSGAMAADSLGADAVDSNMTVELFVETNGYPVVWHPASNAWLVCSNDYWNTRVIDFNTNAWMQFTVCSDYGNKRSAVFLNQHLLLQQVRFIDTNRDKSGRFELDTGSSLTQYFDQVSALYTPSNMPVDLDNDGMADADEIQLYGSVGVRHRPVITVVQPAHGSIAPSNSFEVMPGGSTSFTFHADAAYVVEKVYTNGQSVVAFMGQNTRVASWAWNSIFTNGLSDGTVSALVSYVATRYVPQDGYATIQDAMTAAAPGETVIVSNGTYTGNVALSNGVALVGTNVVVSGNLSVAAGTTATVWNSSGLVVSNGTTTVNGMLVVSNGTVDLGTLVFGDGASVRVVGATSLTANGIVMTGTFTLDASWQQTLVRQTPPFADDFERYPVGQAMSGAGLFGWSTPVGSGVQVQTNHVKEGPGLKAVEIPAEAVLSNALLAAASSNVWMEWNYREAGRIDEGQYVLSESDSNLAALVFINTNGYVALFDPEATGFRVLSNDVWGHSVTNLTTSDWPRLAVNLNYRTRKAAVMLDGRLLAQQVRFINTNQANCARMEWDAGTAGNTYLDDVKVWTNATSVTSLDGDGDGISDAVEIDHSGDVFTWPRGSVFKIR
jgi:hypothetical protein